MSHRERKTDVVLTECCICESIITNPKTLSCLHTYCLTCLEDLVCKGQERGVVSCPMCHEKTSVPSGGVSNLKTNFFVNTLKDHTLAKEKVKDLKKIICTSCDDSDARVVSRCTDCQDFLCAKCMDAHASMRIMKTHHVITMEKLHSVMLESDLQPTCTIHQGQNICIFCETCHEVICEMCTVTKHKKPDHVYVSLERACKLQKKNLLELIKNCMNVSNKVNCVQLYPHINQLIFILVEFL